MSTKLYEGLFSILLIANTMTVFELIFYIYVVNPTIISSVKNLINNQNQNQDSFKQIFNLFVICNKLKICLNES